MKIMKRLKKILVAAIIISAAASCSKEEDSSFPVENGTFSENTLILNYSGQPMVGKQVTFTANPSDASKGWIEISGQDWRKEENGSKLGTSGAVPGMDVTRIDVNVNAEEDQMTFNGNGTQECNQISCTGSINEEGMKLDLNVLVAENSLQGTYHMQKLPQDPFCYNWEADGLSLGMGPAKIEMNAVLNLILNQLQIKEQTVAEKISAHLHEVKFMEDGNVMISYSRKDNLETPVTSPANTACYGKVKDGKFVLYLNPFAIQKARDIQTKSVNLSTLISQIGGQVFSYLETGIPMSFHTNSEGITSVCIDERTLLPILKSLKPLFEDEEFQKTLVGLISSALPENIGGMVGMLLPNLIRQLPDIIDSTRSILLGINLK